jgi:hypothetical protein
LGESLVFDRIDIPLQAFDGDDLPKMKISFSSGADSVAISAPCEVRPDAQQTLLTCHFPEQVTLEKGEYEMEVVVEKIMHGASVVAKVYDSNTPLLQLSIDDTKFDSILGLRGYRRFTPDPYQRVLGDELQEYTITEPEPGVTLIENRLVSASAYYLSTLVGQPQPHYDLLSLSHYHDTSVGLQYKGDRPGWVVLPVRSYPGWTFMVNEREIEPALFKGVLPAVAVSGGETITYRYRPVQYVLPAMVSMIGFLLCIGLFLKAGRVNRWLTDQLK